MNPKKKKDAYVRLKEFAVYVILMLFALALLANIVDDMFLGDRMHGGVDPLLYTLVGSLLTLLFSDRLLRKDK